MKKYELVTVMDTNYSQKEIDEISASIEKKLGKGILDTDKIGLLPTAYPIAWQDQGYYVSYLVELDWDSIPELKSELSIIKWLAKYTLFGMWINEKFMKMGDLQKRFEEVFPVEEEEEVKEEEKPQESKQEAQEEL